MLLDRLLTAATFEGPVEDLRIGTHWTALVARTSAGLRAGLASTQSSHDAEHLRPAVRDAGRLVGRDARELAGWIHSPSPTERSIGFAALNALNMLLSAGLMIALLVYGYQQSLLQVANGDRSQTIGIPIVWYWAPLLLGMARSVLACILRAVRHALAAMGLGNLIASPVGVPAQEAS